MLLRARDVSKTYSIADQTLQVLRGVDLDLAAGETLALTGESGSGKSTLLHLVGGLDVPDAGSIEIEGTDIAGRSDAERAHLRRTDIGVVFQQFNLIPSLTVADNIAFQARLAGSADKELVTYLGQTLGLEDQLAKYPEQLSGGQQQRVAIGRTLAVRPKLVLADEPTGNLDEASAENVMDLFLKLVGETRAGLLLVTHSKSLASRLDRNVHLSAGVVS